MGVLSQNFCSFHNNSILRKNIQPWLQELLETYAGAREGDGALDTALETLMRSTRDLRGQLRLAENDGNINDNINVDMVPLDQSTDNNQERADDDNINEKMALLHQSTDNRERVDDDHLSPLDLLINAARMGKIRKFFLYNI